MKDMYQIITDRVVESLENGVPPWVRPWTRGTEPFPLNAGTRRCYRGINHVLLSLQAMDRGYRRNAWLTYRQAIELGAFVRKGEVGSPIVFYKLREREDDLGSTRSFPVLRGYTAFNVEQIQGLPDHMQASAVPATWQPLEAAEQLLVDTRATIRHGGDYAFYRPSDDVVQLPDPGSFNSRESYYATALHEVTHWSGHPSRLDRQLGKRFGASAYAIEELIAEMGAAFICPQIGIPARLQHASYMVSWINVLASDKRAVVTAASKAQQAADYVLELGRKDVRAVDLRDSAEVST